MKKNLYCILFFTVLCHYCQAAEWLWQAKDGVPLGRLQTVAGDEAFAEYRPANISSNNHHDIYSCGVNAGEILSFRCEYRIPETFREGTFRLRALFWDSEGVIMGDSLSPMVSAACDWQSAYTVFAVPDGVTAVTLRLINTGVGSVQIRKASFTAASPEEADTAKIFAGTLEEKIVLHSHTIGGSPTAGAVLDYNDHAPGDPYSVKIIWDNDTGTSGLVDIESPMEIPAGLEHRLERVVFFLKVTRNTGDLKLQPLVLVGDVNHCPENLAFDVMDFTAEMPADSQWHKFEYTVPADKDIKKAKFSLRLHGQGNTTFRIGLPEFYYSDGTVAEGFTVWDDPLWRFEDWSEKKFISKFTDSDGMVLCAANQSVEAGEKGRAALLKLKEMFPNFANDFIYAIDTTLANRQWFEDNDIPVVYQNIPNELWQMAVAIDPDMLCYDPDSGRGFNEHLHKFNAAHPAWRDVFRAFAGRMKDYGMPEVMSIDCIFQFQGDARQYEPWYREFLLETDEGFAFKDSDERLFFSDYFQMYAGFKPYSEYFGWNTWNEYTITRKSLWNRNLPVLEQRRGWLDTLLRHYAFLMYNVRIGEELGAQNIAYFLMNNGDDWLNGNDWQINARTQGVAGFVEETFFYHPTCVYHAATDAMSFREFFDFYNCRHRLIQEVGLGGHGFPYWDVFNTFALVSTVCAAAPFSSLQVDWPFESFMEAVSGSDSPYHIQRYNTFVTMVQAYNLQRELGNGDIPEYHRKTLLFHETQTNAAFFEDQRRRLCNALEKGPWLGSNATFNLWELPYVKEAKVLFNDYYAMPEGGAEKLLGWFWEQPERALVLTGFSAGKKVNGSYWGAAMGWDQMTLNAPDQFADVIGEIKQEGRRYYAGIDADDVLLADASGMPILSVYYYSGGRKVYYYSPIPGDEPELDKECIDIVMSREYGEPDYKKLKGDTRTFIYRYADGTSLFAMFSHEAMERFFMHPVIRTENCFQFNDPAVDNTVGVTAAPGEYVLYRFLADTADNVTVGDDGWTDIELQGQSGELCYLIPAWDSDKLQRLRGVRARWISTLKE